MMLGWRGNKKESNLENHSEFSLKNVPSRPEVKGREQQPLAVCAFALT